LRMKSTGLPYTNLDMTKLDETLQQAINENKH